MASLHPLIDNGLPKADPNKERGVLYCKCYAGSGQVEVALSSNVMFNHLCGCSKCWRPKGALFSVVGVVPSNKLSVTGGGAKLHVVDPKAVIQRWACKGCGVHMFGRITQDHAFKGLDFVHVELANKGGWQEPQFAAFVSSIIEQGFDPEKMGDVRQKLQELGLETYDCLSPALMDLLAAHTAKQLGPHPKM